MRLRFPRKLKKCFKKMYLNAILLNNPSVPNRQIRQQLTFLYNETIDYDYNQLLEDTELCLNNDNEAIRLGLNVNTDKNLKLQEEFGFSLN